MQIMVSSEQPYQTVCKVCGVHLTIERGDISVALSTLSEHLQQHAEWEVKRAYEWVDVARLSA